MKNYKSWVLTAANREQDVKLFEILFSFMKSKTLIQLVLFFVLLNLSYYSFSQNTDSTKVISNFAGAVTVTNNGISFIPTFSLGKPAAIFDMTVGRKLSFEPQFRFALEGKPWSFIFWWRYKLVKTNKIAINLGAHPAILFKTVTDTVNGVSQEMIRAQRNVAVELSPNYFLSKNISIGMYYLYGYCLENFSIKNTHYLTFNISFSNIRLPYQYYMKFTPQVYYLKMDKQHGFYFSSALTLANRKFPISISTLINNIITTDITASKNFVWNVSLIYSFNKKYVEL